MRLILTTLAILSVFAATAQETPPPITRTFSFNGCDVEFVAVSGGSFFMGASTDPDDEFFYDKDAQDYETPWHKVTVSDFWISKYPVTQKFWKAVTGLEPNDDVLYNINDEPYSQVWSNYPDQVGDDYPAFYLSYNDVKKFCPKLSDIYSNKISFSMPTEAQWEFAARGGKLNQNNYRFAGSDIYSDVAWTSENSGGVAHLVGQKQPNQLGLYDMSGNVQEWCKDLYVHYDDPNSPMSKGIETDPCCTYGVQGAVVRSGSFGNYAIYCRSTYRFYLDTDTRMNYTGARIVINKLPIEEGLVAVGNQTIQRFVAEANNGTLNISGATSEVRIYNLLGAECATINPQADGSASFDLRALAREIYIVRCADYAAKIVNH